MYLNGFTIVSFNHKNKFITYKTENYFFDDIYTPITLLNTNSEDNSNQNDVNNNDTGNNNQIEYWIVEDSEGNNKIRITNNNSIISENIKAGPFFDEAAALTLLNYLNDMEYF